VREGNKGESVEVSRETIATLASQAASSVDGVVACQRKTVESFASRVKREFVHKGVKVEGEENGPYRLSVYVRVRYGVELPALAASLREKVTEYLQGLAGVDVEDIEVVVEDIEIPAETDRKD